MRLTNGDVRKAPREQLPFVEVDGEGNPGLERDHQQLEGGAPRSSTRTSTPRQRAVALAFKSMLEEDLYFGLLFMRWACDDGWAVFEPSLRDMLGKMGGAVAHARHGREERAQVHDGANEDAGNGAKTAV